MPPPITQSTDATTPMRCQPLRRIFITPATDATPQLARCGRRRRATDTRTRPRSCRGLEFCLPNDVICKLRRNFGQTGIFNLGQGYEELHPTPLAGGFEAARIRRTKNGLPLPPSAVAVSYCAAHTAVTAGDLFAAKKSEGSSPQALAAFACTWSCSALRRWPSARTASRAA
jgi:hypothetical protein